MRSNYKFRHLTGRFIQASFAHIPGKWASTGTHSMKEAVLWAEHRLEADLKHNTRRECPTLSSFSKDFFTEADPQGWRNRMDKRNKSFEQTFYQQNQARLNNYIVPRFGDYLLSSLNDIMIEDWFIDLISYRDNSPLADNTKNKILICLRTILQEAVRQRYISENPANKVKLINARYNARKPFTDIELFKMFPKDEKELLYIWGNRNWAVYFLIMRDTGFRPGEAAALSSECYNVELKGLYTERSIDFSTREIKERIKTTGKGKNYKVGLLTDQTVIQLNKLLLEKQYEPESLFLRVNNRPIIPDVANKHLRLSLKRADVDRKERTQYSLRHSFETDLAGRVENSLLLELMAHTNFRKEYDHRTPHDILKQLQPVREVLEKRS